MAERSERGYLDRGDAAIYYEIRGSGPGLVFAHGLGGNHLSWWQQVPHFAARYTCVTFSHRGFALSRLDPAGRGCDAFGADLAALVQHLELKDVTLVCQSMGGWSGIDYALSAGNRVRALVLASTSGRIDYARVGGADAERLRRWNEAAPQRLAGLQSRGIQVALGERGAREQPALHYLYQQIEALTPSEVRERMRREILAARDLPPERLRDLAVPLLYIVGDEDVVFPADAAEPLARCSRNARVERVPEAGHSVYFERPQRFNAIVEGFLSATPR
ncbi:MAG TPA: alpha/beta hydrolase [Stellaceae bacterium]|nr:alpha/beta hydrolase [Stellaceae bacterium]